MKYKPLENQTAQAKFFDIIAKDYFITKKELSVLILYPDFTFQKVGEIFNSTKQNIEYLYKNALQKISNVKSLQDTIDDLLNQESDDTHKDIQYLWSVLNIETRCLPFSVAVKHVLQRQNINYLGQLVQTSPDYLMTLPSIGPKSIVKIKKILHAYGLVFGIQTYNWQAPSFVRKNRKVLVNLD